MASDNQFLALLERDKPKIEPLIAPYFDRELWFSNARNLWKQIQRDDKLRACSMESLVGCVEEAARRGLEIGGPNKHCAVVAFKTTAILITQWQGKAFQWMKSGSIKKLSANIIYEGEHYAILAGDEDRIEHTPDTTTDRKAGWLNNIDNIVGAYAIATLWSGEKAHAFVNRAYLKRLMDWTKAKNNGSLGFGWRDWLPEMCMKTAVHRLDGKIQPPPHMDPEQIAAWQRASVTQIEPEFARVDEPEPQIPPASDGTEAPSPRRVKAEIDPKKEDRPLSTGEVDDLFDQWISLGGKRSALGPFLEKNFSVDDLVKIKLSQVEPLTAAMQQELAA